MHMEDALAQTKEFKGSDTVDSKDHKASKPYLALIPLLMLVGGVVFGIIYTGSRSEASNLMEVVVQVMVILPCSGEVYYR